TGAKTGAARVARPQRGSTSRSERGRGEPGDAGRATADSDGGSSVRSVAADPARGLRPEVWDLHRAGQLGGDQADPVLPRWSQAEDASLRASQARLIFDHD